MLSSTRRPTEICAPLYGVGVNVEMRLRISMEPVLKISNVTRTLVSRFKYCTRRPIGIIGGRKTTERATIVSSN